MRVAYFSPLPPDRSGIADYSALLLPALSERIDVKVVRRGARRPPFRTDVALYQVGNNPEAHDWIVRALRRQSGVVVLHDFVLHHLVAGMTLGTGDRRAYLTALEREAGVLGRMLGHAVADGSIAPLWETKAEEFPLAHWVLDHAEGVIVHSRYVEERVRAVGYTGPVWRVPMPVPPPPPAHDPGLPRGAPLIGSLGHLNEAKRIPQLLEAFALLRHTRPEALLVLAGWTSPRLALDERLSRLGLERGRDVFVLDYVPEDRLWNLIRHCDVCVSLRSPTMGETSGMVVRMLAVGTPVVVSDVGWFSELPDEVAAKVPVDEWEVETIAAMLDLLAGDDDLRRRMGEAGRELARSHHAVGHVADLYVAALEEVAGRDDVELRVLRDVAQAAGEVGLTPDSAEIEILTKRLREVGFGA
ncbi:MAG: glycosyltransferase family 4 protein [Gaiellales bacterium]